MTAYLDGYSGYSGVPEDAAAEILEKLMTHQQISSDEVAQILKRYGVCGEPEALQIAYRKGRPAAHCQSPRSIWQARGVLHRQHLRSGGLLQ